MMETAADSTRTPYPPIHIGCVATFEHSRILNLHGIADGDVDTLQTSHSPSDDLDRSRFSCSTSSRKDLTGNFSKNDQNSVRGKIDKSILQMIYQWDASTCRDKHYFKDRIEQIPKKFTGISSWSIAFTYHICDDMRVALEEDLAGSCQPPTDFYLEPSEDAPGNCRKCSISSDGTSFSSSLVIIVKGGQAEKLSQISTKLPNFIACLEVRPPEDVVDEFNMDLHYGDGTCQDEFSRSNGIGWDLYRLSAIHVPNDILLKSLNRCSSYNTPLVDVMLSCKASAARGDEVKTEIKRPHIACPKGLNDSQFLSISTIDKAIRTQEASINIIHGPPGTGKTATLVALIDTLLQRKLCVLAAAPSNHAVCELARRCCADLLLNGTHKLKKRHLILVGKEKNLILSPELEMIHLDRIVIRLVEALDSWSPTFDHLRTLLRDRSTEEDNKPDELINCLDLCLTYCGTISDHLPACNFNEGRGLVFLQEVRAAMESLIKSLRAGNAVFTLSTVLKQIECSDFKSVIAVCAAAYKVVNEQAGISRNTKNMEADIVGDASVIFSTVDSARHHAIVAKDVVVTIVDEAAQLVEARIAIVLSPSLKHLVLAGDNKQLPPTVKSMLAKSKGYDISLLDRLLDGGFPCTLLDTQYRMHPAISLFPNKTFYKGKVQDGDNVKSKAYDKSWHSFLPPLSVYDVEGEETRDDNQSYWNATECQVMKEVIKRLDAILASSSDDDASPLVKVGIIAPYSAQLRKIGATVASLPKVRISVIYNTVDGFQGQECDVIIFLCVRCNAGGHIGFLDDERRLNVAITRAKYSLLIIGSCRTLSKCSVWKGLLTVAPGTFNTIMNHGTSEIIQTVILKQEKEKEKLEKLKIVNTCIFENTVWMGKFIIMAPLKRTLPRITDPSSKNLVWSLLIRLAEGRWPRAVRCSAVVDSSCNLENIVFSSSVDGKVLLWSLDLVQVH